MPLKLKYNEGEQILCFHGPLLYDAKCLKVEAKEKTVKYLVHYSGWSKSWDEWVLESRIMKHNEAGLAKQKELQKAHSVKARKHKDSDKVPKKGDRSKDSTKATTQSCENEVRKRARQSEGASASEAPKKKKAKVEEVAEVQVKIPKELKTWLVDDWDLITRQKQLVSIPTEMNVKKVLEEFIKETKGGEELEEVVTGLIEYFDCMLGTQLLYKQERPQYSEILQKHPGKAMSELYGVEHLLRLFVAIGSLLSCLDAKCLDLLLNHFQQLLSYLSSNSTKLFSTDHYIVCPPEHIRKVL